MDNLEIAWVLSRIADYYEILGESAFRVNAYRRAAETVERLDRPVAEVLEDLPGVGKSIRAVIEELLTTGESQLLRSLEERVPGDLLRLLDVPGIGPRTIYRLYTELGLTTVEEVRAAAEAKKIRTLKGFGGKVEARILEGIRAMGKRRERVPLAEVYPLAQALVAQIRRIPGVLDAVVGGSIRRVEPTIGDIDIAVKTTTPEEVSERIVRLRGVREILARGEDALSFQYELLWPIRVDIRFFAPEIFGSGLVYFTGDKEHNIYLRRLAKGRGYHLSEWGFEREADPTDRILCPEEEDVYRVLDLFAPSPELRIGDTPFRPENRERISHLVRLEDIRGDLHMHTDYSDGGDTLEAMARAALARGYTYIAITDHSRSLKVAGGLSLERLREQGEEIRRLEERLSEEAGRPFVILRGAEVDILPDGSLDYEDEVLRELDLVVASVHTHFQQSREEITARIVRAARHPFVDIIGHPTGRVYGRRDAYALDVEALIAAAQESGVTLELNSHPYRLDLGPPHLALAQEHGVRIAINTDAHNVEGLEDMFFGVATARKAYVLRDTVINTWDFPRLWSYLRRNRGPSPYRGRQV
ncbi:DNA polymerase/3'-5' exonuclease PolX [Brockia lithotrophica]|uniref:DNA-directed DNA polymerase n=1 Tax=Brockia lithotrophica TaxID=933949 RepID=A0A660KU81_9BACL|nr:DNA polymerase/3'-5' exonuclease PolX [Brockia lithotrophica]RKQ84598.1 DNA polymerase (family 10) [Brockia lithotrophica]